MVESKNELYDVIKSMCDEKGVSIAQMCRDIGMRDGLISDLKVGKETDLSMSSLFKLAEYFCCSTDVFFRRRATSEEGAMENEQYAVIERLCKRKGIKISNLCHHLGIRDSTMSELKSNRTKYLSSENVVKIAKYFGVSADMILGIKPLAKKSGPKPQEITIGVKADGMDEILEKAERLNKLLTQAENIIKEMSLGVWR